MKRHDVNTVQSLYIASLVQAARKLAACVQANGGFGKTPKAAFEEEMKELLDKTSQLTKFERSPQAREGLRCRSDSAELTDVLARAMSFLSNPEHLELMNLDDQEIAETFELPDDQEPEPEPDPQPTEVPSDNLDAFDL